MAKKKKAAKPAAKRPAPARRSAGGKKTKTTARRTSGAARGGAPFKVSTGSGPGPAEVGRDLVAMFNAGKFSEIEDKWWAPSIESIEGLGMGWRGRRAVEAKNADWLSRNIIRGASAEGPYVGASGFAVKFRMDVEERATGKRFLAEEIGVYTLKNGKIIREEFMYGATTEQTTAAPSAT